MADPFLGEIRIFAGTFAPVGWMFCEGQLLPISENDALFNLIGTTYGGDGEQTFALPDLRGRLPLHQGTAASGSSFLMGQNGGVESVTLTVQQLPSHQHLLLAAEAAASQSSPTGNVPAEAVKRFFASPPAPSAFSSGAITPAGGSQPHDNMQPYLCLSFIIAIFGRFPSQN